MAPLTPPELMDAAWAMIKESGGSLWKRTVRRAMKTELSAVFPDVNENQLSHACYMAKGLLDACYTVGEACRVEAIPRDEAEASLKAEYPGFSDETYTQAVSYGMYVSR